MNRLSRSLRSERGALAVIVAILFTVFGFFVAIVVDVGYLYETRRQLQAAADAAALAGMQEKLLGADETQVLNVAEDYAKKNDFDQDRGTAKELQMPRTAPDTEVAEDYVKVTVRKDVSLFFAPLFNIISTDRDYSQEQVSAQSKARRVYLTGGISMMPWGVFTIRPTRITATVNGVGTELAYDNSSDTWNGSLPVPAAASTTGYPVDLTIYNSQDYPETLTGMSSLVVHGGGDEVTNVYFEDNTLTAGATTYLYVSASQPPRARMDNRNYNSFESLGGGLYRTLVTAPEIDNSLTTFPVEVTAGGTSIQNAAFLVVRKSTHPVESVTVEQTHFAAGGGATGISVRIKTFEYGELYDLKVTSNPEAGNFQALDFRYITHPDGTQEGLNDSAADYYENLSLPYPGEIHIGDVITTKTGNLSGPQTESNLDTRFAGCTLTFAQWEAAGKPADCGRLVMVPIVERIERITGQSDVIVVTPAVFYVEQYAAEGGGNVNVTGRFVEYVKPGAGSTEPPDSGVYVETIRLDRPDY